MIGVLTLRNVTARLLGSAPNKAAVCGHSQKSVSDQCREDGLAGLPIDDPQALGLRQRQAESRHFGVLGTNSARKFVFPVCTRSEFEKSVQQWHDKPPPLPVVDTSEARHVLHATHERAAPGFKEGDGRNAGSGFRSVLHTKAIV
jgi:hypothetical protein